MTPTRRGRPQVLLQGGTLRRHDRRRARRRLLVLVLGVVLLIAAAFAILVSAGVTLRSPAPDAVPAQPVARPLPRTLHAHPGHRYATQPDVRRLHPRIPGKALLSGMLFDVRTGRVLWARDPTRVLPIASLTKMMTALVTVQHADPGEPVLITTAATHFTGSGVGLLPLGKDVRLESLLYGLLLPSGNDAAIALAQHVAGHQAPFVALMNQAARRMGLTCTHFSTVSGILDAGNYSCAIDLAVLAHAVLTNPRLAPIVASRSAVLPFPIKGGKLYLYNNNPLLIEGYPGADGVKTGYTTAAGPCLVAAARRRGHWFGVVLLHSTDPAGQAAALLNAAFAASRGR